jgi:hypothetical protein
VDWQGEEAQEAALLVRDSDLCLDSQLAFECRTLLADAGAEAMLCTLQPSLCGSGALVNVGPLLLVLPRRRPFKGKLARGKKGGRDERGNRCMGQGEALVDSAQLWE